MKLKSLALLMLLSPSLVLAYYGTPSYRLEEDPDFRMYKDNQESAKIQLAQTEQQKLDKENELRRNEQELIELRRSLQTLPQEKANLERERSSLLSTIQNLKNEIPSLELSISTLKEETKQAQQAFKLTSAKFEQEKINLETLSKSCASTPTPECQASVELKKAEVTNLEKEFVLARDLATTQRTKLENAERPLTQKKSDLANSESRLTAVETRLVEVLKLEHNSVQREAILLNDITRNRNELLMLVRRLDEAEVRMAEAGRNFNRYRDDLIRALDQINREGYINGERDGDLDGSELSRNLGRDEGYSDGRGDGLRDGEYNGRDRDYKRGQELGENEGSDRGRVIGKQDGENEGSLNGHITIGEREGHVAGVSRAEKSDASKAGTLQGNIDGLNRAIQAGLKAGSEIGQKEAIALYENDDLKQLEIKGEYLGSFERQTPRIPGNYRGPRYNPNRSASKDVFRKAYADGYFFKYFDELNLEFNRRIDADYNASYDTNYQSSYSEAINRDYRDSFESGRKTQYDIAYKREYSPARKDAYERVFANVLANPNRQDSNYKNAFTRQELASYNKKYGEIYALNYQAAELKTFDQNIAAKTEEYRQKRLAEVKAIYENNAVAQYVSSSVQDGGLSGVARLDGIFMPGEKVLRTITIKNFGKKELTGAKAQFVTGEDLLLPNIPARSVTTISAGAYSTIPSTTKTGTIFKDHMRVQVPATTSDAVQTRHYEDLSKSLLKALDTKELTVLYPLQLSALSLTEQFALLGKKQKLNLSVANVSKRAYTDEIQVELKGSESLVTKPFNNLTGIAIGAKGLNDAEILVQEEKDTYVPQRLSAIVKIQGVKVGELNVPLDFMPRAAYQEKANKPVLVTNSNVNTNDLLQALDQFGGISEVSVLDYALQALNQQTIANGFENKSVLLIDDGQGNLTKSTEALIAQSKNTLFIHVDERQESLNIATTLAAFKDNQSIPFTLATSKEERRLFFTNPHRAVIKGMSMHLQSNLEKARKDEEDFRLFSKTNAEIAELLKTETNRNSFFAPLKSIQIASLKSLGEILNVNVAYDESGGIFNRDKKWIKMLKEDSSLMHNQIRSKADGNVTEASLGSHLSAIAFKDIVNNSIDYYRPVSKGMKLKVDSTVSEILNDMENNFKKNLKKFDRTLNDKAFAQYEQHRPYKIDVPENTN